MRTLLFLIPMFFILVTCDASAQVTQPGFGFSFENPPASWDSLEYWRQKRARDFWNRTSPSFGDPWYDPLRTSPLSPFRAPEFHPWATSPFRGDPYYDPYAPRHVPDAPRYDPYAPRYDPYAPRRGRLGSGWRR